MPVAKLACTRGLSPNLTKQLAIKILLAFIIICLRLCKSETENFYIASRTCRPWRKTAPSKLSEDDCSLKNNIIICCLKCDPSCVCKNCESADRSLQESGLQLHSQRMALYQANQLPVYSWKEKNWLCTELGRRDRTLQETRMRNLQEMEELKKLCCTEAESVQQLRTDQLSRQEFQERQSTVIQLTVQIRE